LGWQYNCHPNWSPSPYDFFRSLFWYVAFSNRVLDPLGAELGQARLLRASALVPVPDAC
jgi:hypothetical protein